MNQSQNQNNINAVIAQLWEIWDALPNAIPAEQTIRENFRKKIEALQQAEIKELEALGTIGDTFLQEKSNWLTEKKKLAKDKKDAETALLTEKKKLSEDLVTKLDSIVAADGKLDESKVAELKTLLTDLKEKKATLELSEAQRKEIAKEVKESQPTNYWSIGACIFASLAAVIAMASLIFKSKEAK